MAAAVSLDAVDSARSPLELREAIAALAPTFAGLRIDSAGALVVMSTGPGLGGALTTRIQQALGAAARTSTGALRPVRYQLVARPLRELLRVRNAALQLVGTHQLTLVALDEARDQVTLGIRSEQQRAPLLASLLAAGTDTSGVRIVVRPPIIVKPADCDPVTAIAPCDGRGSGDGYPPQPGPVIGNLAAHFRPLVGGLRIIRPNGDFCTLGPVVLRRNAQGQPDASLGQYALINGHCMSTPFSITAGSYSQPNASWPVGYEHFVAPSRQTGAPWWAVIVFGGCPGWRCRMADVAVLKLLEGVHSTFGHVATGAQSNLDFTGLRDVATRTALVVGMPAEKTGATSGSSVGIVTGINTFIVVQTHTGYQYGLIDQAEASYYSYFGDSGSPVFSNNALLGISAAIDTDSSNRWTASYFSPVTNIESELGPDFVVVR